MQEIDINESLYVTYRRIYAIGIGYSNHSAFRYNISHVLYLLHFISMRYAGVVLSVQNVTWDAKQCL